MNKKNSSEEGKHIVARNRKARHQYHIHETTEAGIALQGTEVKSLREGKVNLKDSFASIEKGEVYLHECHISPYQSGSYANHNPTRSRKLLLHKREIVRLFGKVQAKGFTLVPLSIYFTRGKAKVNLALASGKKQYDKREDIKRRDLEREMKRERSFKW